MRQYKVIFTIEVNTAATDEDEAHMIALDCADWGNADVEILEEEDASKLYKIRDVEDGSVYTMTLPMILDMINGDRPADSPQYNETDWREGLADYTTYEVLEDE